MGIKLKHETLPNGCIDLMDSGPRGTGWTKERKGDSGTPRTFCNPNNQTQCKGGLTAQEMAVCINLVARETVFRLESLATCHKARAVQFNNRSHLLLIVQ
jgi:hypothetical protein